MTQPFYVSPEQVMKDRADYARKGIARGRSVVVLGYEGGIAFVAQNPSRALHKISEIYDRIGFAAVGKYNEFENLRVAGVRYADLRGYSYDRADVTARGLANAYAQTLGTVFTQEHKPYEVEIVVAEVGRRPDDDQIYRLTYDGSVADEHGYVVMGGATEAAAAVMAAQWRPGLHLWQALRVAVTALSAPVPPGAPAVASPGGAAGDAAAPAARDLEVAVLDRTRPRRTFRRIPAPLLGQLLNAADPLADLPDADDLVLTTSGTPVPQHRDAPPGGVSNPATQRTAATPPDRMPPDEASPDRTPPDQTPPDQTPQAQTPQAQTPRDETARPETPHDEERE